MRRFEGSLAMLEQSHEDILAQCQQADLAVGAFL